MICKTGYSGSIDPFNRYINPLKSWKMHLRLTLRQLQIFVAVARCGSTTAASTELALSQSATSSAINELATSAVAAPV